ncbi:LOW QUALITY PROTEIN: ferrichrome-binding periplasmic protein precursor [Geomicrobium sp. JCM 19038]|nr:LOW QUALITY PROTEIN: ferrichrome-binding periplasmic protein precursor [Geomicrobium sp. JCM 19038]
MRKQHTCIAVGILTLSLVACDATSEADNTTETSEDSIVVQDIYGEQVLDEVPERVVALEWLYAENLLALGIDPVGVADIEGFETWDIDAELSDEVVDVGLRTEPNLEVIAGLEPDLIIMLDNRTESVLQELQTIAPTLTYNPYPEEEEGIDQYEEMEDTFMEIAKAVDQVNAAEEVLEDLETIYTEANNTIDQLSLDTTEFTLAMGYTDNQAPVFRLSNPNALAVKILENIGLTNAYDSGSFESAGFATVGVEELTKIEESNFMHIVQDSDNIFEDHLSDNAVWNDLTFVQENNVFALGGDTWPYGGPLAAKTLVERTVAVLEEN